MKRTKIKRSKNNKKKLGEEISEYIPLLDFDIPTTTEEYLGKIG